MNRTITIALALASIPALAACKRKAAAKADQQAAPAAKPKPAAATDQAKQWKTCADWGLEGDGTFFEPCKGKGDATVASPFELTFTGNYKTDVFGQETAVFKLVSKFERTANWGNVGIWYYDKDGKLLEATGQDGNPYRYYWASGGTISIDPGQTQEINTGWDKQHAPAGAVAIEAEVTSWGNNLPGEEIFIQGYSDGRDFATRPQGGWK